MLAIVLATGTGFMKGGSGAGLVPLLRPAGNGWRNAEDMASLRCGRVGGGDMFSKFAGLPLVGRLRLIGGRRRLVLAFVLGVEDLAGEINGDASMAFMLVGARGRLGGLVGFISSSIEVLWCC